VKLFIRVIFSTTPHPLKSLITNEQAHVHYSNEETELETNNASGPGRH
jgi:hypothetical protein